MKFIYRWKQSYPLGGQLQHLSNSAMSERNKIFFNEKEFEFFYVLLADSPTFLSEYGKTVQNWTGGCKNALIYRTELCKKLWGLSARNNIKFHSPPAVQNFLCHILAS